MPPIEFSGFEDVIIIPFRKNKTALEPSALAFIESTLIPYMKEDERSILDITTYAPPTSIDQKSARKQALDRAISIRNHLLENGLEQKRISMHTLSSDDNTPRNVSADRAEIIVIPSNE